MRIGQKEKKEYNNKNKKKGFSDPSYTSYLSAPVYSNSTYIPTSWFIVKSSKIR